MKTSQLVLATLALTTTLSASAGIYVGGQLGWGDVRQKGFTTYFLNGVINQLTPNGPISSSSTSNRQTGLAGQINAGYQFNQNWAVEVGYTRFSAAISRASVSGVDLESSFPYTMTGRGSIDTDAYDLVVKGMLPVQDHIGFYGKLGLAYLRANGQLSSIMQETGISISASSVSRVDERRVYPTYAFGISYDITKKITTDISWTRIQKVGGGSLPSTDFAALGLLYRFG